MTEPLSHRAVVSLLGGTPRDVQVVERVTVGYDAFQAGRQVTRMRGTAGVAGGGRRDWSLVEKVTGPPRVASAYVRGLAERELAAYRFGGVTDDVPGFAAPALPAHEVAEDGTITLMLEDVGSDDVWSPDTYRLAARHLGRLAGRWLGRVPPHSWLLDDWASHHSQLPALAEGRRLVAHHLSAPPPELQDTSYADAQRLLDAQPRIHRALHRLPQTLCHHDAVRSNLVARPGPSGAEIVAIDWELVGPGAVGADLASLLFGSVRRGDLDVDLLDALVEPAVDSYVEGMHDMHAGVPREVVRTGLALATCLRWTLLRDVLVCAAQGDDAFRRGTAHGEPPVEARRQLMALTHFLDREARHAARAVAGER